MSTPTASPGGRPGTEDRAVVAGISRYPALGDLKGPENDAHAFHEWLVTAGGVPAKRAKLILSSQFKQTNDALRARPTSERIEREFDSLYARALQRSAAGAGMRLGRRLYIFLAGHGFSVGKDQTALLMANATRDIVHHVPAEPYANHFLDKGIFDQVVLFMDCCRERYPQAPLRVPPYIVLVNPSTVDRSRLLFGFATQWTRASREKPFDGKVRGIFTTALLEGLRVGVAGRTARITARSLSDYLYNNMAKLLTEEERNDPEVPKFPEMIFDQNPAADFLVTTVRPPADVTVRVRLQPADAGKQVEILSDRFEVVASTRAQPPRWTVALPRGFYLAQVLVNGVRRKGFEVSGERDVDIDL
jgi:hypothetical protein